MSMIATYLIKDDPSAAIVTDFYNAADPNIEEIKKRNLFIEIDNSLYREALKDWDNVRVNTEEGTLYFITVNIIVTYFIFDDPKKAEISHFYLADKEDIAEIKQNNLWIEIDQSQFKKALANINTARIDSTSSSLIFLDEAPILATYEILGDPQYGQILGYYSRENHDIIALKENNLWIEINHTEHEQALANYKTVRVDVINNYLVFLDQPVIKYGREDIKEQRDFYLREKFTYEGIKTSAGKSSQLALTSLITAVNANIITSKITYKLSDTDYLIFDCNNEDETIAANEKQRLINLAVEASQHSLKCYEAERLCYELWDANNNIDVVKEYKTIFESL